MNGDLFMDGKWLTSIKSTDAIFYSSDRPIDFERTFTLNGYFSTDVLAKIEENPGYIIEFDGGARGIVEGIDQGGVIVRMKNSEFQKLRMVME